MFVDCHDVQTTIRLPAPVLLPKVGAQVVVLVWFHSAVDCCFVMVANADEARRRAVQQRTCFFTQPPGFARVYGSPCCLRSSMRARLPVK